MENALNLICTFIYIFLIVSQYFIHRLIHGGPNSVS